MTGIPTGFAAGYIAVEASGGGEDLVYWILDQVQMDEVEELYKETNDYGEAMDEIIENHDLGLAGRRCTTIREANDKMAQLKLFLVEDFSYICC